MYTFVKQEQTVRIKTDNYLKGYNHGSANKN